MLAFIDAEKRIKIMRVTSTDTGEVKREWLGTVPKRDMGVSPELKEKLRPDEGKEIDRIIEFYGKSDGMRAKYHVSQLPIILREVADYFETSADELERSVITSSVLEILRRIRSFDRNGKAEEEKAS